MGRRDVIDFKGQFWAILSDLFTSLRDVYHQQVHDGQKAQTVPVMLNIITVEALLLLFDITYYFKLNYRLQQTKNYKLTV